MGRIKNSFTQQIAKAHEIVIASRELSELLRQTEDRMGVVYIHEDLIKKLLSYCNLITTYVEIIQKAKGEKEWPAIR